jgi:peptidoglycan/LPS O-acetylase OafA/YrhL
MMSNRMETFASTDMESISGDAEKKKRPYYFQLDVLKAIAIIFVVMDHSLYWDIKSSIASIFWERLSIPFFLMVMGFNMGLSFKYSGASSLRDFYTWEYIKRKIVRYILPFLVLYMGSILLGLYFGYLSFNEYTLLGYLPFWGPGNWFIPLLFGFVIVFPFIYWAFKQQPIITMVSCFLSEICLQLVMYFWFPYPIDSALEGFIVSAIRVNVLFFLPAIALGMWFSEDHDLFSRHNRFLLVYAPICFIFMIDYATTPHVLSSISGYIGYFFTTIDNIFRGDYTLLFYGYAAVFMLLALMTIPQIAKGRYQRFFQKIGKASYHILLFQIFWMSIVYWLASHEATYYHEIPVFQEIYGWSTPLLYIPFYLMNLAIALAGGLLWYEAEKRAGAKGKPWWQHIWFRRTYHLFGALLSLVSMATLIEFVNDITGLTEWGRTHGPYIVLNEVTGPVVMLDFIVILLCIGVCMLLMYRSFTIDDGEIPV